MDPMGIRVGNRRIPYVKRQRGTPSDVWHRSLADPNHYHPAVRQCHPFSRCPRCGSTSAAGTFSLKNSGFLVGFLRASPWWLIVSPLRKPGVSPLTSRKKNLIKWWMILTTYIYSNDPPGDWGSWWISKVEVGEGRHRKGVKVGRGWASCRVVADKCWGRWFHMGCLGVV